MIKTIKEYILQKIKNATSNSDIILGIGRNIISEKKQLVTINEKTLNRHVYLLGSTGSGKTTLLRNIAYQAVKNRWGVMFIDMKGGQSAKDTIRDIWLACIESQRGRDFVYLSPVEIIDGLKTTTWNPTTRGDATIVANKIFDALRNIAVNAQFYEDVKFDVLLKLVSAAKKTNQPFTLGTLAKALESIGSLAAFARKIPVSNERKMIENLVEEWATNKMQFIKNIKGTVVSLQMLSMSYPSVILETTTPNFDLLEAVEKQKVVYVLLPTLLAKESMQQIAKMLLSELKTVAGELLTQKQKKAKFLVIVDEFEEMIFPGVRDLFNKAREAGISMIVGHQTIADVEMEGGEAMARSLMDNTATKIFMQMKSAKSAEMAAETIGKYQEIPVVSKYLKMHYIVPPEIFMGKNVLYDQGLQIGEAIVKIDAEVYRVVVPYPYKREKTKMGVDIPLPMN